MAKNNILSVEEIEHFLERVRATVHAAQESHSLREALSHLVGRGQAAHLARQSASQSPSHSQSGSAPVQSNKGAQGAKVKDANEGNKSGGRKARVGDSQILDLIRRGVNGVGMRELEKELGQHVETIRLKLRKLRKEGHVRTTGPRNQLRYHSAAGGNEGNVAAPTGEAHGKATHATKEPRAAKGTKGGKGQKGEKGQKGQKGHKANAADAGAGHSTATARSGNGARATATAALEGIEDRLVGLIRTAGAAGTQMNHLATELKVDPKSIRKLLERLRQGGHIQVTGQRRATRYHAAG